ncbi:hypothetical protein AVEN_51124-1, partial [Araneus ventricosus]
ASSMSSTRNTSPTSSSKRIPIRRKKLPFSENITNSHDPSPCPDEKVKETNTSKESTSLTPRRNPPLSERQQIALICRLSGTSSTG